MDIHQFSNHLVHLKPASFLHLTRNLHSDESPSNHKPMIWTKCLYYIFHLDVWFGRKGLLLLLFHHNFKKVIHFWNDMRWVNDNRFFCCCCFFVNYTFDVISHTFTACLIFTFNDYTNFRLFFKHMLLLQVLQGCLFPFFVTLHLPTFLFLFACWLLW